MPFRVRIAGNSFRDVAGQLAMQALERGDNLTLQPEPDNQYDPNAIKVLTEAGVCIGYVPKYKNVEVGDLINDSEEVITLYTGDGWMEIADKAEAEDHEGGEDESE